MLNFPIDFFDDEVRDGFYVPSIMKHNWAAQMEIVNTVDAICKKNNIKYYLFAGTLLGTIRHGGFIPWDDDVDICMLRKDYMRFVRAVMRDKPDSYWVRNCHEDPSYRDVFTRLLNAEGIAMEPDFWQMGHGFVVNAGIDVFPLDYIPKDSAKREEISNQLMHFNYILKKYDEEGLTPELEGKLRNIENIFNIKIKRDDTIPQQMYLLSEDVLCAIKASESNGVEISLNWAQNSSLKGIPIDCFKETTKVPFETTTFDAPFLYDKFLKSSFRNYMRPLRVCDIHNYPWYQGLFDDLRREMALGDYPFKKELLPESDRHASWENALVTELNEHMELFGKASALAEKALKSGDSQSGNMLLEKCRTLAENAEMIENKLKSAANNRVILFTWKAEYWKFLEPYYRMELEAGNEVLVVPVPYRRLTEVREWSDDYIETEGFPEDVELTDFSSVDYEGVRVCRIYTQNPCDDSNGAIRLHDFFHTTNLNKITDELIYVPWFELDEYTEADERAMYMMKEFLYLPGIVVADRICLPKSQEWILPLCIKKLVEWAGEDTKDVWENKFEIVDTNALMLKETPSDSETNEKKVLLYYIGTGQILADPAKMIAKLESNLQVFEKSAVKIRVKFFLEKGIKENVNKYCSNHYNAFCKVCKEYESREWCDYIEAEEPLDINKPFIHNLVDESTAIYGDAGILMHLFNRAKKPVMIQSLEV